MTTTATSLWPQASERVECALLVHPTRARSAVQPVTVGIPFSKGSLPATDAVVLVDGEKQGNPLQQTPLARWSDGSVKWLLLDFLLPAEAESPLNLRLAESSSTRVAASGVNVHEMSDRIVIDTGIATFEVDSQSLFPIKQ